MLFVGDPQMTAPRFKVFLRSVLYALSNGLKGFSMDMVLVGRYVLVPGYATPRCGTDSLHVLLPEHLVH